MKTRIPYWYATSFILLFLLVVPLSAVQQGEIELKLNGKTTTVAGLMATMETKEGKPMLYLGAADPVARTKINISLVLSGPLHSRHSFSSLDNQLLFTLKSPESTMLIMPPVQPVKSSLELIETDPDDPEGYYAAIATQRTKVRHEMSAEDLKKEEQNMRRMKPRTFRKEVAPWDKMDMATRLKTGQGITVNQGQGDNAIFLTIEPVFSGDTIVELKGTISGFARGKQNRRWLLETSEFRAIFINR